MIKTKSRIRNLLIISIAILHLAGCDIQNAPAEIADPIAEVSNGAITLKNSRFLSGSYVCTKNCGFLANKETKATFEFTKHGLTDFTFVHAVENREMTIRANYRKDGLLISIADDDPNKIKSWANVIGNCILSDDLSKRSRLFCGFKRMERKPILKISSDLRVAQLEKDGTVNWEKSFAVDPLSYGTLAKGLYIVRGVQREGMSKEAQENFRRYAEMTYGYFSPLLYIDANGGAYSCFGCGISLPEFELN